MDLASGIDLLQQRVLVNLAVDSHRQPLLQVRRQRGEVRAEAGEQLADARGLHLQLGDAARELAQIAGHGYVSHSRLLAPTLAPGRRYPSERCFRTMPMS